MKTLYFCGQNIFLELPTSKVRSFMPYSWVPNKQGVLNKRGGQKMYEKLISELGLNKRGGGRGRKFLIQNIEYRP